MRAPKAQSYVAQLLVRVPKARSFGTHPSLHDRAGTFANYNIKSKQNSHIVPTYVCISSDKKTNMHARIM